MHRKYPIPSENICITYFYHTSFSLAQKLSRPFLRPSHTGLPLITNFQFHVLKSWLI